MAMSVKRFVCEKRPMTRSHRKRIVLILAIVAASALWTQCSRESKSASICPFIIGGDTVSLLTVQRLVPDSLPRPRQIIRAALELACVKAAGRGASAPPDSQVLSQIGLDLAHQLSNLEADPWTSYAGKNLYLAAKVIAQKKRDLHSFPAVKAYADSLLSSAVVFCDGAIAHEYSSEKRSLFDTTACRSDSTCLESMLCFLFYLSKPAARIVREFAVTAENESVKTSSAETLIKGLLSSGSKPQTQKTMPKAISKEAAGPKKSEQALRLRNQQSIKDSIEKHIPNLEALYRKHLKTHQTMEGVIWVTFEINPAGGAVSATIKTSTITEKEFLRPFREYVLHYIHFQKIPEASGNMSVEFPFEFSRDN
jgi:hypothetical protein